MPEPVHPVAAVQLLLAGAPAVRIGTATQPLAAPDALLLCWLALEGATRRERLAELLWPDSGPEAARNALRQRLFRLRRQIGVELVQGGAVLALAPEVRHDLQDPASLLGDLHPGDSPTLADWLTRRRTALRARQRPALEARIEALEASGDLAAALPLAIELCQVEPLSEDAHRRVMRLHYLRGDRASALLAFDACERTLKDEIGTTPSPATLALLQTIEADASADPPPDAPHDTPRDARPDAVTHAAARDGSAPAPARRAWHGPVPAAVLRPPRMVGRATELLALQRGWAAGCVLLVTGEAGMGKSRLLQTLARQHEGVLLVSARPGDELVPYASLVRLLQAVLGSAPSLVLPAGLRASLAPLLPALATNPADAGASLPRTLGRRLGLVAPVQELLALGARAQDTALRAGAQDTALRAGVQDTALRAVVLDDLHFADEASVELLQALLTAGGDTASGDAPLRWCLGLRPPTPGARQQALIDALAAALPLLRVKVQALTAGQVAELVDSLGLPGVDGAALAPALRQRTGGNPLFALETLKLAWAEGGPTRLAASDAADAAAALPHPQSLDQLIGQQLARLSPAALMLARVAAIAGTDFTLPLAEKVLGHSALQLADPWHELESQQVLTGTEFAHDLVFEAVLAGVPAVIARHLHGQIAALLEAGNGEPARIAAHWEAAGQRERALPGLRAAAERAHRALRERERLDFLLRAADIAEATGDRRQAFDCVLSAVATHMNAIRQADGFPLLDRLDRLAETPAERAQALGCRAWYSSQLPDHAEAARLGQAALELAEPLGERSLIGPIRQRLATALAMLGRFDEALEHLRAVQAWADEALAADDLAEFHGNFAVALDNLGQPEAALPHHRRALAHSQAVADHAQRATHLGNHAVNRLNAGDACGAQALVEQALALVVSFDLHGASVAFLWLLRSHCARALGRWRDALAAAEQALALLDRSNPARRPLVLLQRAHCWLDLGLHSRAHPDLQAAGEGALPPHVNTRRLLLLARWQAERGLDAQSTLAQAAETVAPNGWPEVAMNVTLEQAALQPLPHALPLLQRVLQEAGPRGLRGTVLRVQLLQARLCAAAGDGAAAAAAARAALALGEPVTPADGTPGPVVPTLRPRADVWLHAAQGLAASPLAADRALAAAVAARGQAWLSQALAEQVDAVFTDGARTRNPAHAALLNWRA